MPNVRECEVKTMEQAYIYNCPVKCPIHKHCFIIKLENKLEQPLTVLKKCDAEKGRDILVKIGGELPPR
jgi:hypothetical protein